jgi:2'-5' RNA ligase
LKENDFMETPQSLTQLPGYRLYDYLLVLSPHEEMRNKIIKLKNEFGEKYKAPVSRLTKPHITLARFINRGMTEEKLVNRLQAISMGIKPFKVECKDFGSFPSHTIFINVVSRAPIQGLVKELKPAQPLMKLNNEHKPHFIDEPNFTICRKLKPWQYEQGWLEYSHRHFNGSFIADSMLLIKRPSGLKGSFQIAKRFEFENLPVLTKQGNLF